MIPRATRTSLVVLLAAVLLGFQAVAAQCADGLYGLADVKDAPRFEDFLVPAERLDYPARPVLTSRDAREFRTMLREAAAKGPNFAGHYTIAVWGCGAGCNDFGIIDAKSGRVFFEPDLRDISAVDVEDPDAQYINLRFRADSRLLVVIGAPKEDEARDGVAFYEWTGAGLKLLRFEARSQILAAVCR
jgi:hypothetical protein